MLTSLRIENFVIVETLELDFAQGMTTFTGETGAGKSIMIDALTLALGARADASVVRSGAEKCDIHASFSYDSHSQPAEWLALHDFDPADGELVLRRVIFSEGRSKSYINGVPFPLQKIKELSELLVDIHGQHEHQTLLQHATHRRQLDDYAGHTVLLEDVKQCHQTCQQLKQRLVALQQYASAKERMALLEFQLNELVELNLQPGELDTLHQEHQCLHHARDYLQATHAIVELLSCDDQPSIRHSLNLALQRLASLPADHPHIQSTSDLLNSALIQCDEAYHELGLFSSKVQLDPERLQEIEARMSVLHQMARKYHIDANGLIAHQAHLENELIQIRSMESQAIALQADYDLALQRYEEAARILRSSRQQHALRLAEEISQVICELGMPKARLTVDITPLDVMQSHGLDKVEYRVCTNPGQPPDLLVKIASGGELSRISLAIQMVTAQRGSTPTLLFDEVDVGIGGATAALVGQMLRKLGQRLQLFCVTHQPQVASAAHHHFIVEKYTEGDRTFSTIAALSPVERIDEIARMLSGLIVTDQTRSHANELLQQAMMDQ